MMNKSQKIARGSFLKKLNDGSYTTSPLSCLCGKTNDVIVAKKDRYNIPLQTVLCLNCGLLRSNPYYTDDTLIKFYNNEYRRLYGSDSKTKDEFFAEQETFGGNIIEYLLKNTGISLENKKVFEIGCGAGGILSSFKKVGAVVYGCDYGSDYVEFGKNRGLTLENGGPDALDKFGKADVIILNHTLEHMRNPITELQKINLLLNDAGILHIAVPGVLNIHKTYGSLHAFLQNAHAFHFTRETLSDVVSKAGFKLLVGDENIGAVFNKTTDIPPIHQNPEVVRQYIRKIKITGPLIRMTKIDYKLVLLETLRKSPQFYLFVRNVYRKFHKNHV